MACKLPRYVQTSATAKALSLFVAVGNADGTDAYIIRSPTGVTWTERANSDNLLLDAVTAGSSLLVAVGQQTGALQPYVTTSPDGITWTLRENPKNEQLEALVVSPRLVLASGGATGPYLISSREGGSWTNRENLNATSFLLAGAWSDVAKRFVMVGDSSGGTDTIIITSFAN